MLRLHFSPLYFGWQRKWITPLSQQSTFGGRGEPQPIGERRLRAPEPFADGLRWIDAATQYLAWARRRVAGNRWRTEDGGERGHELVYAGRGAGGGVVGGRGRSTERGPH